VKIAAATGLELAIDIAPAGQEPKLVGKTVKDALKCRFFVDGASRDRTGDLLLAKRHGRPTEWPDFPAFMRVCGP